MDELVKKTVRTPAVCAAEILLSSLSPTIKASNGATSGKRERAWVIRAGFGISRPPVSKAERKASKKTDRSFPVSYSMISYFLKGIEELVTATTFKPDSFNS